MTPVSLIGPGCVNGLACNGGKPARPVYLDGYCWWCFAAKRRIEGVETFLECCVCNGDPRGGEVQPIHGREPLLFCAPCAEAIRGRRNIAATLSRIWELPTMGEAA